MRTFGPKLAIVLLALLPACGDGESREDPIDEPDEDAGGLDCATVTTCDRGDDCCPDGCNANDDDDCEPTCGNDVVESGELCDGDCPTECDDGNPCTTDVLEGHPDRCDAVCATAPVEECSSRDGCCPAGCNVTDDSDCLDRDRDGLGDDLEATYGTDPDDPDTDADGFFDSDEVLRGTDPVDSDSRPAAYEGLTHYAGDAHVHSATAMEVVTLAFFGYDPDDCEGQLYIGGTAPHSHVWCDKVFDRARDAGLDWVVLANHALGLLDRLAPEGPERTYFEQVYVDFWTNPDYQDFANPFFPDDPDHQYPTHPEGFSLWTEEGFTDSEWLSMQRCGEFKTEPGVFVAIGSIEFTAQGNPAACAGEPYCGGHRTVLYQHESDKTCAATPSHPEENCDEGELYEHVRELAGVANVAHPWWLGPALLPYDPETTRSGLDDELTVGLELSFSASRDAEEDLPGHSYRETLDAGFHVHPLFGTDTHNKPPSECGGDTVPGFGELGPRSLCWQTGLTRAELIASMLQHRCYYSSRGKPAVRFSIEGRPMGARFGSDRIADPDRGVHLVVDVARGDGHPLGEWDLVHDGEVVEAFTDVPCESADACTFDGHYRPADLEGYYYVRVTDGEAPNQKRIVTAPIWITEPE